MVSTMPNIMETIDRFPLTPVYHVPERKLWRRHTPLKLRRYIHVRNSPYIYNVRLFTYHTYTSPKYSKGFPSCCPYKEIALPYLDVRRIILHLLWIFILRKPFWSLTRFIIQRSGDLIYYNIISWVISMLMFNVECFIKVNVLRIFLLKLVALHGEDDK